MVSSNLSEVQLGGDAGGNGSLCLSDSVYVHLIYGDVQLRGVSCLAGSLSITGAGTCAATMAATVPLVVQKNLALVASNTLRVTLSNLAGVRGRVVLSGSGLYINNRHVTSSTALRACSAAGVYEHGHCHCFVDSDDSNDCSDYMPSGSSVTSTSAPSSSAGACDVVTISDWADLTEALSCHTAASVVVHWQHLMHSWQHDYEAGVAQLYLTEITGNLTISVNAGAVLGTLRFPWLARVGGAVNIAVTSPGAASRTAGILHNLWMPMLASVSGAVHIGGPAFTGQVDNIALGGAMDDDKDGDRDSEDPTPPADHLLDVGGVFINTGPFSNSARGLFQVNLLNLGTVAGPVDVVVSDTLFSVALSMNELAGPAVLAGSVSITAASVDALLSTLTVSGVAELHGSWTVAAASTAEIQTVTLQGHATRGLVMAGNLTAAVANNARITKLEVSNLYALDGQLIITKNNVGTIRGLIVNGKAVEDAAQINQCEGRGWHEYLQFSSPLDDCQCFQPDRLWPCTATEPTTATTTATSTPTSTATTTTTPGLSNLTTPAVVPTGSSVTPSTTTITTAPATTTSTSSSSSPSTTTTSPTTSATSSASPSSSTTTASTTAAGDLVLLLTVHGPVATLPNTQVAPWLQAVRTALLQGPVIEEALLAVELVRGRTPKVRVVLVSTAERDNLLRYTQLEPLRLFFDGTAYQLTAPDVDEANNDNQGTTTKMPVAAIAGLAAGLALVLLVVLVTVAKQRRDRRVASFKSFHNAPDGGELGNVYSNSVDMAPPAVGANLMLHQAVLRGDLHAMRHLIDQRSDSTGDDLGTSPSDVYLQQILSVSPPTSDTRPLGTTDGSASAGASEDHAELVVDERLLDELLSDDLVASLHSSPMDTTAMPAAAAAAAPDFMETNFDMLSSTMSLSSPHSSQRSSSGLHSQPINAVDATGSTPLMLAVQTNNLEAARLLLQRGANPNLPNLQGQVPLHLACANDAVAPDMVALLLAHHAVVNAADQEGWTPLIYLCRSGNPMPKASQLLSVPTLDALHRDVRGMTALMHAAVNDQIPLVELLCAQGDEITDKTGWTALHWAASVGSVKAISLLQPRTDGFPVSITGETPLHLVARVGNIFACQILLDAFSSPAAVLKLLLAQTAEGLTAMAVAERRQHPECAAALTAHLQRLLIDHGANLSDELREWGMATLQRQQYQQQLQQQSIEKRLLNASLAVASDGSSSTDDSGFDELSSADGTSSRKRKNSECSGAERSAKRPAVGSTPSSLSKIEQLNASNIRLFQQMDMLRATKARLAQQIMERRDDIRAALDGGTEA